MLCPTDGLCVLRLYLSSVCLFFDIAFFLLKKLVRGFWIVSSLLGTIIAGNQQLKRFVGMGILELTDVRMGNEE